MQAAGADLSYQWSVNGVPVAGATAPSFTIPAVGFGDHGDLFRVTVTNPFGSVTSNAAYGDRSPGRAGPRRRRSSRSRRT